MGLLDSLFSSGSGGGGLLGDMDDPQQAGKMAMIMGLLEAGGPSATPTSFGQAFAQAYGQGTKTYRGMQQALDDRQLRGLKTKEATLSLQKMETDLEKQKRLQDAYKEFYSRREGQTTGVQTSPVAGLLDSAEFPRQPMPDWMPKQSAPAPQAAGINQPIMGSDNYTRHLQFAQFLESRNQGEEAAKYYDLAEKFKPKVKEQKVLMQNGKPVTVNVYEDGRTELVNGFDPTPKLHFADDGQRTAIPVNEYTGTSVGPGIQKRQSPESAASNALGWANYNVSKQRLALDQNAPKGTYDHERGVLVDGRTGEARPVTMNGQPIGVKEKPLTETQGAAAGFGLRAKEAQNILNSLESRDKKAGGPVIDGGRIREGAARLPLIGGAVGDSVNALPTWAGGPNEQQQGYMQAKQNFITAVLRKESGAVIGADEYRTEDRKYFPQPGDGPTIIAQKRAARDLAIQALEVQAGRPLPNAKSNAGGRAGGASADWDSGGMPSDISDLLKKHGGR